MKKKVKIIIAGVIAVAAIAAGIYYAAQPITVEVLPMHETTAALIFTEQGTYDYTRRVEVYPLLSGEILEILAEEGDTVRAGDVIAIVNAADYEFQISQLESTIAGFRAQISNLALQEQRERESADSTLEGLRGQLSVIEAERRLNRTNRQSLQAQIEIQERIIKNSNDLLNDAYYEWIDARRARDRDYDNEPAVSLTFQQYTMMLENYNRAQQQLEQLKAGEVPENIFDSQRDAILGQIEAISEQAGKTYSSGMVQFYNAQIEHAQTAIAQVESMAGRAEITAPSGGVISRLPIKDTNMIISSQPVAVLASRAEVEVFVPIREIDGVSLGDKVELTLDRRLGEITLMGTVVEIEREAVAKMSALGTPERKVRVLIRPDGGGLHIGYDMDVRFTVYRAENVIVAPKTALFGKGGEDFVWVLEDGAVHTRAVTKGIETRDGYIIDEGLSPGDLVVTDANNSALAQGKKAR
ncbi:MAG: HlyD family efflux transporter periplasmic adaptor subunit [Oscillospiraceae bacterium]|nr:HlyD family efflux transporter periplasmic adaptor subunit [Oscillospiraceae bacterium]